MWSKKTKQGHYPPLATKSSDYKQSPETAVQHNVHIQYPPTRKLVWGDAKADNVLIRDDGSLVLVDFGGGNTENWVDKSNYETEKGDWQGYERILKFMSERVTS